MGYSVDEISTSEQWEIRAYPDSGYRNVILESAPDIGTKEETLRVQHVHCKDGSVKHIKFQDFPVDDEYFITIMEDISEKLEIESNLMDAEERYERIVHNFPIPIVVSRADMKILYLNKEFERVFGYDIIDIPNNQEWMKLAYPDPNYRTQITHDMSVLPYERILWNRERRITCKDGTTKRIVINSIPISTDETLTILQNVTPLRNAEEHLQQQGDEYRKIVEDASDMIFTEYQLKE